jgi:outer membrane protein assembly factor BamB
MNKQPVRWWPAIIIAALAACAMLLIWVIPEIPRQQRIMRTGGALMLFGLLLFVWMLLFSRFAWRTRFRVLAICVLCLAAGVGTFRIRGVNGDLLPILEPRWRGERTFARTEAPTAARTSNIVAVVTTMEFPQFYGPTRNAVLPGPILETNWTSHPPKILWKQEVGSGWSGFVVKDGLAITQEQRGDEEYVVCYELLSGRTLWSHADNARYATTIAGEGPRATPTIDGERVYTFGGTGILNCLDFRNGKLLWQVDTVKEQGAIVPDWGYASSPLIVDEQVLVSVGSNQNSLVSYSAESGKLLWASGKGSVDYSSPVESTLLGVRQILNFNTKGVSSHALDGKELWHHPWPGGHPHVTAPLVIGTNHVLISSGYGTGCELIRIEKNSEEVWSVTREWKSMSLKSKFAPIFVKDDYIYGLDDGIFTCVAMKTGQRLWKDGRYGHGQGLLVGGIILLTSEKGEVVLIDPNPEKLVEISRFQVFSDKTWNPPALAGEYLLMRNDKEAACLQLPSTPQLARNVAVSFAKPLSHR